MGKIGHLSECHLGRVAHQITDPAMHWCCATAAIGAEDMLVLAGPTMELDGPAAVYRWPGALASKKDSLNPRKNLQRVLDVPYVCIRE